MSSSWTTGSVGNSGTESVDTGNRRSHLLSFKGETPMRWGFVHPGSPPPWSSALGALQRAANSELQRGHSLLIRFGQALYTALTSPALSFGVASCRELPTACLRRKAPGTLCGDSPSGPGPTLDTHGGGFEERRKALCQSRRGQERKISDRLGISFMKEHAFLISILVFSAWRISD